MPVILIGLVLVFVQPHRLRGVWLLVAVALAFAFCLDQHRLQPWAYQSAIYAMVFAVFRPAEHRRILIPLAASIYIYSAAGKLDYQFAHSVGQEFLDCLLSPLGFADSFTEGTRAKLALLMPSVELCAGVLLLPKSTRRMSALVLMLMHITLIGILGPWSLDHSLGVLVWNAALFAQAYFLFFASPRSSSSDRTPEQNRSRHKELFHAAELNAPVRLARGATRLLVFFAIVAPITERFGGWDHWTSWALYSPHNSRVSVEIHGSAVDDLPGGISGHLDPDEDDDGWQTLALDRWSLESLAVPVYPQARYQLALSHELVRSTEMDPTAIRCRVRSVSDRMTGARQEKPLVGDKEIANALAEYWLVAND